MALTDVENEEELLDEFDEIEEYMEEEDDNRETVAAVSGWGMSIMIHAILFLLLTFIVIAGKIIEEPIPIQVTMVAPPPPPPEVKKDKIDLEKVDVEIVADVVVETPQVTQLDVVVEEISETEDPEIAMTEAKGREEAVSSSEAGGAAAFMAMGAGGGASGMMGNRQGGGKTRALRAGGGSRATEASVDLALRWFVRHQSPNGMWDVDNYQVNCQEAGPKCEPGTSHTGADGDAAVTGYAVLAFLGGGYDHRTPNKYRRTVGAGLDWLVTNQKADGSFGNSRNYENGICAMALAEAFAMTQDPKLREPAQKAIDHLLSVQNGQDNGYGGLGWDYTQPKTRNDSSVSGWVIMALKSANAGGLNIGNGMAGAKVFMEKAWTAANPNVKDPYKDRSGFPYTWDSDTNKASKTDRTAIGVCLAVFLGHDAGDLMLETMANDVMARAFDEKDKHYQIQTYPVNTYYLYYNTLGIFQVGGERWIKWNKAMSELLLTSQRKEDNCFNGSWDSEGTLFHGNKTGRLLSTAYNALTLQVYYRYAKAMK